MTLYEHGKKKCELCDVVVHEMYLKDFKNKLVCILCFVLSEKELIDNNSETELDEFVDGKLLMKKLIEE